VTSDDGLLNYAGQVGVSCYHVMGTARMGRAVDPSTVVDDQLRIHGLDGLRIVDASVMPSMPSGNTCAATMMIAEKGADMIRGRRPPPREIVERRPSDRSDASRKPPTSHAEVIR
jgi:choline dehydrogenase